MLESTLYQNSVLGFSRYLGACTHGLGRSVQYCSLRELPQYRQRTDFRAEPCDPTDEKPVRDNLVSQMG